MRANIIRNGVSALLFLGGFVFQSIPAQALPIGGHPDKCQGPYPNGGPACESAGGHVWCTNDGDYMCCFVNRDTGAMNCQQIEEMPTHPQGLRPPLGTMAPPSVQPSNTQPPKFIPPGGVMRRGVEGEQPETTTGDSSTPKSESK
jgi:hypothetical protein